VCPNQEPAPARPRTSDRSSPEFRATINSAKHSCANSVEGGNITFEVSPAGKFRHLTGRKHRLQCAPRCLSSRRARRWAIPRCGNRAPCGIRLLARERDQPLDVIESADSFDVPTFQCRFSCSLVGGRLLITSVPAQLMYSRLMRKRLRYRSVPAACSALRRSYSVAYPVRFGREAKRRPAIPE
jgi:hypothetical protein